MPSMLSSRRGPEHRELLVDRRQIGAAHRNTRVTIKPRPVRTAWSVPPGHDQGSCRRLRFGGRRCHEAVVGGPDADQRLGPVREKDHRADEPAPVARQPPGHEAEQESDDGKRGLQDKFTLVSGLPLGQEGSLIKDLSCLGKIAGSFLSRPG